MRSRVLSVLLVLSVMLFAVTTYSAARPSTPPPTDSVAIATPHVDSLPSLSFRVGSVADSILVVDAVRSSRPLPTPAHDATLDSVVAHSFVPVTFVSRRARSRIVIPLRRSRHDSLGNPQDDGGS